MTSNEAKGYLKQLGLTQKEAALKFGLSTNGLNNALNKLVVPKQISACIELMLEIYDLKKENKRLLGELEKINEVRNFFLNK